MEIQAWMDDFTAAVRQVFGARVYCVGLQGSRARGEANEDSDIDVVVILDEWRQEDWPRYEAVLGSLPNRDRVCGFVSGKHELLSWEPSELFGFYYDTIPWYGNLEELKTRFDMVDARRAVRIGACGIYHACAHNRLHEKDPAMLRELCKSAFFTLRAAYFCRTGEFVRTKRELMPLLGGEEQEILAAGMRGADGRFAEQSQRLLEWAGSLIQTYTE